MDEFRLRLDRPRYQLERIPLGLFSSDRLKLSKASWPGIDSSHLRLCLRPPLVPTAKSCPTSHSLPCPVPRNPPRSFRRSYIIVMRSGALFLPIMTTTTVRGSDHFVLHDAHSRYLWGSFPICFTFLDPFKNRLASWRYLSYTRGYAVYFVCYLGWV